MEKIKRIKGLIEYQIFKLKCKKYELREVPIYEGNKLVASIGLP